MIKKDWRLSASFISAFKSCPMRCYLKYVLGLVPIEDTDSQRQGTNWHKLLEIMGMRPETLCPDCIKNEIDYQEKLGRGDSECPLCNGTNLLPENMMDAVIRYLNKTYATVPMSKTKEQWLTERAILLYSLCGYNWRYVENDYEVVAEEIQFNLPVLNPSTGRALPNVKLQGKIDKIVQNPNGIYYIDEHKSTSKSVDSDSTFWSHLTLDTQTKLYPYAAQRLQLAGEFIQYGIKPTNPLIRGVRYDAWHKPGISPKKLTQADSKKFVETGEYMGEKFEVVISEDREDPAITVNEELTEVELGKKEGTFAVRETPEMFGARLLIDIAERPDFYFARREINRIDQELKAFEWDIYNIYKTVRSMYKDNRWWTNEQQCEATFRCPYTSICYNGIDVSDGSVPEGFKCIFNKDKS